MHDAVVTEQNSDSYENSFEMNNRYGKRYVVVHVIVCPNKECREFFMTVGLYEPAFYQVGGAQRTQRGKLAKHWQILPASSAKVFPEYVPQAIRDDYSEACLIRDLTPKASATLSRRCLQGMIRDFWQITKGRLVDEIDELKARVDPPVWGAIDSLRKLGNIGAHMEKDVNLIIDIEPQEAGLLIGLIEFLIEQWYVRRHEQEKMLNQVTLLAQQKQVPQTQSTPQATAPAAKAKLP